MTVEQVIYRIQVTLARVTGVLTRQLLARPDCQYIGDVYELQLVQITSARLDVLLNFILAMKKFPDKFPLGGKTHFPEIASRCLEDVNIPGDGFDQIDDAIARAVEAFRLLLYGLTAEDEAKMATDAAAVLAWNRWSHSNNPSGVDHLAAFREHAYVLMQISGVLRLRQAERNERKTASNG